MTETCLALSVNPSLVLTNTDTFRTRRRGNCFDDQVHDPLYNYTIHKLAEEECTESYDTVIPDDCDSYIDVDLAANEMACVKFNHATCPEVRVGGLASEWGEYFEYNRPLNYFERFAAIACTPIYTSWDWLDENTEDMDEFPIYNREECLQSRALHGGFPGWETDSPDMSCGYIEFKPAIDVAHACDLPLDNNNVIACMPGVSPDCANIVAPNSRCSLVPGAGCGLPYPGYHPESTTGDAKETLQYCKDCASLCSSRASCDDCMIKCHGHKHKMEQNIHLKVHAQGFEPKINFRAP